MAENLILIGSLLLLMGCRTTHDGADPLQSLDHVQVSAEAEAVCKPMETRVQYSCWTSGENLPLTHCVLWKEDEPRCGLAAKVGAYLNRGAPSRTERGRSGWAIISFFEDEQGRVGLGAVPETGSMYLSHHSESPPATGQPDSVRWPRWPEGLEFGPEQVRR